MARPSKLTPEQWAEIKKKHTVDGVSIRQLAKEYGVGEATVRDYFKKETAHSRADARDRIENAAIIAIEAVRNADIEPDEVGPALAKAALIESVRERLNRLSDNNLAVALEISEISRKNLHRLADKDGIVEPEVLKQLAIMAETSNRYAYVGMDVAKNNKDKDLGSGKREILLINAPED